MAENTWESFVTPELREWARARDGEEAHQLRCITCGGRFTRIFTAPPRDEAEAKQRQGDLLVPQCPLCSRYRQR